MSNKFDKDNKSSQQQYLDKRRDICIADRFLGISFRRDQPWKREAGLLLLWEAYGLIDLQETKAYILAALKSLPA